jgi:hypothetical protein
LQSSSSRGWSCLHSSSLFLFVSGCVLLRVAIIFRELVHLYIFDVILTDFLDVVLLIFLKLGVVFELVEIWDLSVVVCDNSGGGIVQVQAACLAGLEVLNVWVLLLDTLLFLCGVHLYSYD